MVILVVRTIVTENLYVTQVSQCVSKSLIINVDFRWGKNTYSWQWW